MRQRVPRLPIAAAGLVAIASFGTTGAATATWNRQLYGLQTSASGIGVRAARAPDSPPANGESPHAIITRRWAGYFRLSGEVRSVRGTWVVPRLSCGNVDTRSSTWTGVGGLTGGTLLQAGMYDNCLGGIAVQGAFAEEYPGSTVSFELLIKPGDEVTATIAKGLSGWYARVSDETTGESEVARAPNFRGGTSAEWMVEANGLPEGEPMTNFGSERLRAFSINDAPARISRTDVYEMSNVVATDPSTGVYRIIFR